MLLVQLNTQPEHPDYAQIRQPPPLASPSIIRRFFVIDSLSPHSPDVSIDTLSRGICAEQQTPRAGDTGQAGQGRPACHDSGFGRAYASRTPRCNDLGAAPETGVTPGILPSALRASLRLFQIAPGALVGIDIDKSAGQPVCTAKAAATRSGTGRCPMNMPGLRRDGANRGPRRHREDPRLPGCEKG